MTTTQEIIGKSLTYGEFDLDVFRATQFETVRASKVVPNWTSVWDQHVSFRGIVDETMPSGRAMRVLKQVGTDNSLVKWDLAPNIQDVSITAYQRNASGTANNFMSIGVRISGNDGSQNGYVLSLVPGSGLVRITKFRAGVPTTVVEEALTSNVSEAWWLRLDAVNIVGGAVLVRGKAWQGEQSDEPELFTLSADDETLPITTAGFVGVLATHLTDDMTVGYFRIRSILGSLTETLVHAIPTPYLPFSSSAPVTPDIVSVSISPGEVSLGENLGARTKVTFQFRDHPGADMGEFFDSGTHWGKFRGRKLFRRGQPARLIRQLLDEDATVETRHYVLESQDGPTVQGMFSLVALDVLNLAGDDRAQCPVMSEGFLQAELLAAGTSATLSPVGIGDFYPTEFYANIGGEEVVAAYRDPGIDESTTLLMHFNGTNGSTTMTDSSGNGHNGLANGNAQLSTTSAKFGSACLLLDGTGDFVSFTNHVDFAMGEGDFTLEGWFNLTTGGSIRYIYDGRPTSTNGFYLTVYIAADNTLRFFSNGADRIVGTTTITTGTYHFWRLVRSNGVIRLFLGLAGAVVVQQGADFGDLNGYTNGVGRPVIGINGHTSGNAFVGRMDEIRLDKGVARSFDFLFRPPAAEFDENSGDVLNLVRAQFNTTAVDHDPEDRVQECEYFDAQTVDTILHRLLTVFAGIDDSYIDLDAWSVEAETYSGVLYTRLVTEPTGVAKLASDLIQQAGLLVWSDELENQIRMQVIRGIATTAFEYDQSNVLAGTLGVQEQPGKRITQCWVYFGVRNYLKSMDETENFRSTLILVDAEGQTEHGEAIIKKVYASWIPQFGSDAAQRVADLQVGRFKTAPRKFAFDVQRYSGVMEPANGNGARISWWGSQDELGVQHNVPIQIVQVDPQADRWKVLAEEMLFESFSEVDTTNRVITVDADYNDFNLREVHDNIYPAITADDVANGVNITCIVASGATVGATLTLFRAFEVGSWPILPPITVRVIGRVQGRGGDGGGQATGPEGLPGGPAFRTTVPITLDLSSGAAEIWGGGGGGARQVGSGDPLPLYGGGGGQGQLGGTGGVGINGAASGENGSSDERGAAGQNAGTPDLSPDGDGGAAGEAGESGFLASGGAAGAAIEGDAFITYIGTGDIRGSVS